MVSYCAPLLTTQHEVFNGFSVDTKVSPIWNTMASIPGHIRDEVVLIGCHRDGTYVLLRSKNIR